ncbi:MAG TPA: tetratricopeptide repeat protein [Opitutaceae bacterium]
MTAESDPLQPWKDELDAIVAARHGGALAQTLPRLRALAARFPDAAEIHYQIAWTHDANDASGEATPHYDKAIELGLKDESLAGAMLGLGSSLRVVGQFGRSERVLREALERFPDHNEFRAFLALTLHDLGRHAEAMSLALTTLIDTADDPGITAYQRAIRYYVGELGKQ